MYFSLITPRAGREREAAYDGGAGAYAEHQWLWRFFPATAGTPRDFLFRRSDVEHMPRYYVVSDRAPEARNEAWQIQTRTYAPKLAKGQRLNFELRANPVVTQSKDKKSARHDVVMREKKRLLEERGLTRWSDWHDADKPSLYELVNDTCSAWLNSRADRLGFQVNELMAESYQKHVEKTNLQFSTIDYTGQLTVIDPEAVGLALRNGIGRAKAFGCGLLLVRPAS